MQDYYEVQELIGKKQIKNKVFYRVKWKGFSVQESTWEKESNLKNVKDLIEDFQKRNFQTHKEVQLETSNQEIAVKKKTRKSDLSLNDVKVPPNQDESKNHLEQQMHKPIRRSRNKTLRNDQTKNGLLLNDSIATQSLKMPVGCQKAGKIISKKQSEQKKPKKRKKARKQEIMKPNDIFQDSSDYSFLGCHRTLQQSLPKQTQQVEEHLDAPSFKKMIKTIENLTSKLLNNAEESENIAPQKIQYTQEAITHNLNKPQNLPYFDKDQELQGNKSPQPDVLLDQQLLQPQHEQEQPARITEKQINDRDQKKTFQTFSSRSSAKSMKERLQTRSQDKRIGNIKIRLLDSDDAQPDLREYLVQYENGTMKILNSIEIVVSHPVEFVIYLQGKLHRTK